MLLNLQRKELSQLNQEEEQQKEDIQQEVIVSVKNTGTGIYAEIYRRLFLKLRRNLKKGQV